MKTFICRIRQDGDELGTSSNSPNPTGKLANRYLDVNNIFQPIGNMYVHAQLACWWMILSMVLMLCQVWIMTEEATILLLYPKKDATKDFSPRETISLDLESSLKSEGKGPVHYLLILKSLVNGHWWRTSLGPEQSAGDDENWTWNEQYRIRGKGDTSVLRSLISIAVLSLWAEQFDKFVVF